MYFYHENYHANCYDTYNVDATLQDFRPRNLSGEARSFEPIRVPAILKWLAIVSVAVCAIFTALDILS